MPSCSWMVSLRCWGRPARARPAYSKPSLVCCRLPVSLGTVCRRSGYLPQGYALFPHLMAWQNVAFGLKGPRRERRHRAVQRLQWLGLAALAGDPPTNSFDAAVVAVRSEGLQHRVTLEAGGTRIEALLPASAAMPCVGDVLRLTVSPAHMHLLPMDDAAIGRDDDRLVKP